MQCLDAATVRRRSICPSRSLLLQSARVAPFIHLAAAAAAAAAAANACHPRPDPRLASHSGCSRSSTPATLAGSPPSLARSLVTAIHRSLSLPFSPSSAHSPASQPIPFPPPTHPLRNLVGSSLGTSTRRTSSSLGGRPVALTVRSTGSRYLYAFPYPSLPYRLSRPPPVSKHLFRSGPHLYTSPSPRSLPCSTSVDLGEPTRPSGAFRSRFRHLPIQPWPRPSHNYPYTRPKRHARVLPLKLRSHTHIRTRPCFVCIQSKSFRTCA